MHFILLVLALVVLMVLLPIVLKLGLDLIKYAFDLGPGGALHPACPCARGPEGALHPACLCARGPDGSASNRLDAGLGSQRATKNLPTIPRKHKINFIIIFAHFAVRYLLAASNIWLLAYSLGHGLLYASWGQLSHG